MQDLKESKHETVLYGCTLRNDKNASEYNLFGEHCKTPS